MKKLLLASAAVIVLASCSKKQEETGAITTEETTMTNPDTTTTTVVTPVDSATAVTEATTATTADQTNTTKSTTGEVYKYTSDDSKTNFSVIYDAEKGTAAVKNETTGKTYDMKNAVSGSGAKFEDKDGNFFWTHQGEFTFGKGEKDLIKGKEVK